MPLCFAWTCLITKSSSASPGCGGAIALSLSLSPMKRLTEFLEHGMELTPPLKPLTPGLSRNVSC